MSKNPPGHVTFPASATPASFFEKSVSNFKTQFAIFLKDQLIGKALTRPSDNGMFSYDVVQRYPDLEAAYVATCPERMDLVTMQKTVMKYVDELPAKAFSVIADQWDVLNAAASASEVAATVKNGSAAIGDLSFRDIVVASGVALLAAGKLDTERGDVVSTSKGNGKVQTRPRPGGKANESFALIDPLVSPPGLIATWFAQVVSAPVELVYNDVALICDNCCAFNANNTIDTSFVVAAKSMKDHGYLCCQSVESQFQALFFRWWKAGGLWKIICTEAAKVGPVRRSPLPQSNAPAVTVTTAPTPEATRRISRRNTDPADSQNLSLSTTELPAIASLPVEAPVVASVVAPTPLAAPTAATKQQPHLRDAFPRTAPSASAGHDLPPTVSKATSKIQLTKIAAIEESRRVEKKRLLDLLARYQLQQNGEDSSNRTAAVATSKDCPQSLHYAIPQSIRVESVVNHLRVKETALEVAERLREEALLSVFSEHQSTAGDSLSTDQLGAAAVLFSVFDTDIAPKCLKTENDEVIVPSATPKQSTHRSASIFSSESGQSALSTLTNFYDTVAAVSQGGKRETNSDSVADELFSAYSDMQLAELRDLLTLLVAALHKATTATSVLFYGHEIAAWYLREHSSIASAGTEQSDGISVGWKRSRDNESAGAAHSPNDAAFPSFWSSGNFPELSAAQSALRTAQILSTAVLVRLLLWFPHLVATCASAASATRER
eukprot:GILI01012175.1.p1 GENE.GILI01012175.1~~GILI01012175.1.p1  ORF type:complete len:722 (+),score=103.60 GILI01012175.1:42-2207(+)